MGQLVSFPTNLPPAAISRIAGRMVTRYSPSEIGDAIELLMDLLDCLGGDPDLEETDPPEDDDPKEQDDDSGQATEDEVSYDDRGFGMRGPGCPISDPGENTGDHEQAWC